MNLFMDNFDEGVEPKKKKYDINLINSFISRLGPNVKILMTCRTDFVKSDNDYLWFKNPDSKHEPKVFVRCPD